MTPRPSMVPLSVLDLSPVPSEQSSADALRNTIDLAIETERLGYRRFWLAEHHLNPGVAGSAPHVLSALVAADVVVAVDKSEASTLAKAMRHG